MNWVPIRVVPPLTQFKKGDAHILAAVAGGMTNATLPIEVQVVGYSLLTDLVGLLGSYNVSRRKVAA
jgi:hypothetical protein